jgi:hypothetical protein
LSFLIHQSLYPSFQVQPSTILASIPSMPVLTIPVWFSLSFQFPLWKSLPFLSPYFQSVEVSAVLQSINHFASL